MTRAVFDYYEALRVRGQPSENAFCQHVAFKASGMTGLAECLQRVGYQPSSPPQPNEHRGESLLSEVIDVQIKGDFAVATVQAHIFDNGALGHPHHERLLFAREGGEWGYVWGQQSDAWQLFGGQ